MCRARPALLASVIVISISLSIIGNGLDADIVESESPNAIGDGGIAREGDSCFEFSVSPASNETETMVARAIDPNADLATTDEFTSQLRIASVTLVGGFDASEEWGTDVSVVDDAISSELTTTMNFQRFDLVEIPTSRTYRNLPDGSTGSAMTRNYDEIGVNIGNMTSGDQTTVVSPDPIDSSLIVVSAVAANHGIFRALVLGAIVGWIQRRRR